MRSQRPDGGDPGEPRLSDDEIRGIAEQLVRELQEPPAARSGARLSAQRHELAPADEERVAEAVAALGAADPEATMRADRLAAGDPGPRPRSWALDGRAPERADD